jgi:hypothetical protein
MLHSAAMALCLASMVATAKDDSARLKFFKTMVCCFNFDQLVASTFNLSKDD